MKRSTKLTQLGRAVGASASPERRSSKACPIRIRHRLCGALYRAGIHHPLPDHRPARLRPFRDRLCAGQDNREIQIVEALSGQLPQRLRLSRRLARLSSESASCRRSSRAICASRAIGIRAAACRSMSSGRQDSCRKACGCRTQALPPIAGGDDASRNRARAGERQARTLGHAADLHRGHDGLCRRQSANGVYSYENFDKYWADDDRFPFWAIYSGERVGFALVWNDRDHEIFRMSEFYVRPDLVA